MLQRALRDLAWSIDSPSLIDSQSQLIPSAQQTDWESYRKTLPQSLCAPPNHRVGKYFESLIQFWLQEVLSVHMIAQNKQIIEDGMTKGELDFIFQKNDDTSYAQVIGQRFTRETGMPDISVDLAAKLFRRLTEKYIPLLKELANSYE